jgi:hypothetical protein
VSIENIKSNIVNVAVAGVIRQLNLAQVLFAVVGTTTSTVYVNEGSPASFVIEGDFRNLVAGIRPGVENAGPLFGAFTDTGSGKKPIVINFNALNRFINPSTLTFGRYGTVSAFTFTLLESPADVLGNMGYSLSDVGMFFMNQTGNTLSAPVQANATTAATGGTIADNTYFLKVTAVNANGETIGSNEKSITTSGGGLSTVTAHWAVVTGATGYNVYIGTVSGSENKVASVAGGSTTSLLMTALSGTSGTVPVTNTATTPNVQEFVNIKNVTHQIPAVRSGTWSTLFIDGSTVLYLEAVRDLAGVA